MSYKIYFAFFVLLFFQFNVSNTAAQRTKYSVNESWNFHLGDLENTEKEPTQSSDWEIIDIPHTWNNIDAMDEIPGFFRGVGWYKRQINIPYEKRNQRVTIYFEGANQEVELFINGKKVGKHIGGYTRFSFDITDFIRFDDKNLFAIRVDNSFNESIPPLSADFTFFGGIYRDVYLIFTNETHISTTHYASEGVFVKTKNVNEKNAQLEFETHLSNSYNKNRRIIIEHKLFDPDKKQISSISEKIKLTGKIHSLTNFQKLQISNPKLWDIEKPNLYSVVTQIFDGDNNELLDEVSETFGIRWFEFSAEKGFSLNGKPLKLIGTNRHQCYDKLGNALPDEIHIRDVKLLKEMGGNFLRVSHYPQDPTVMEMCDKLGIITSVEVPIVNAITQSDEFANNCLQMSREMVFQDYNRASVMIWAYMNEVFLKIPNKNDSIHTSKYFNSVRELAQKIDNQIRQDDPSRYTLIPFHGNFNDYHKAGLTLIPQIVGWNLYQGWYGGTFDKFNIFLDDAHKNLPDKPFIITEYGADVDPRLHSFQPVRFDYTAEYANLYHEHYIQAIMERNFVNGANIWNLNDFHSEERGNAVPHINNKGIVSLTRDVKDTYLQYQAMLSETPIINIGGRNWTIRGGNGNIENVCIQPIKVYSNLDEVELILNGNSMGKQRVNNHIAEFQVHFRNGLNTIEARGINNHKTIRDFQRIDFRMIPNDLLSKDLPFDEINVMLGSKRYFEDKQNSVIWLPEQEYKKGSWGYIGGESYTRRTRHGQQPASDVDIKGTTNDPVFQTMRKGIQSFKLDVPNGKYSVYLYFAELESNSSGSTLVYNLGDDVIKEDFTERIFNVEINQNKVIEKLNISSEFGDNRAVIKKFIINVSDEKGITVNFTPVKGEAILNAIRVYRNY